MFFVLSMVLLLPYFAWGFYTLHRRFRYHEEFSLVVEAITLAGLIAFLAVELYVLREGMARESPQAYIFSVLGLFGSGVALYGHMAVSFSSRIMVDFLTHGPDPTDNRPRLGAAESLERMKDWEGAYNEYLVFARMYPKDHEIPLRIAEALLRLERRDEAVSWFERALGRRKKPDDALLVLNRLVEILLKEGARAEARRHLEHFLVRFPEGEGAEIVRARLEKLDDVVPEKNAALTRLSDESLQEQAEDDSSDPEMPLLDVKIARDDLDSLGENEIEGDEFTVQVPDRPSHLGISSLDEQPLEDIEDEKPKRQKSKLGKKGLVAMDDMPTEPEDPN